jgi:hypothetical protein
MTRLQRDGTRPKSSLKASFEDFDTLKKEDARVKPKAKKKQMVTMSQE